MSNVKTLKILNSSFEWQVNINNYEFFSWTRNLRTVDTFELHINRYKAGVQYLVEGNWIIVEIGGKKRAGRIENRKLGLTQEGKASEDYVIKGYSGGQPLLERYIIENTVNPDLIVTSLSPADAQTGVDINANLVITFNQNVIGDTGTVNLYKADTTLVQSWVANTLDVDGNVVTINPTASLDSAESYYVLIDATAFKNANNVYFAGYASDTDWNFTASTGGSGGTTSYLDLNDTSSSRSGKAGYIPRVQTNELEDSYEEIGAIINGSTEKTSLADDDDFAISDSAASNIVKKTLWSTIKSAILSFLQGLGFCKREVLSANRTYYVVPPTDPTNPGSDSNDGLSTSTPLASHNKAYELIGMLDSSTYNVFIDPLTAASTSSVTYNEPSINVRDPLGAGIVFLLGDSANQDNVTINTTGNGIVCTGAVKSQIRDIKLNGSSTGTGITVGRQGILVVDGVHLANFTTGLLAQQSSDIEIRNTNNSTKYSGSFTNVHRCITSSRMSAVSKAFDTTSLTGFSTFLSADKGGNYDFTSATFTKTTGFTGSNLPYALDMLSQVSGISGLPGAGTPTSVRGSQVK